MESNKWIKCMVVATMVALLSAACGTSGASDDAAFVARTMQGDDMNGDASGTEAEPSIGSTAFGAGEADEDAPMPVSESTAPGPSTDDMTQGDGDPNLITAWEDVPSGVVQIFGEGDFVEADFARLSIGEDRNQVGLGSGFLVSSDGVIVTNNHVVTGAASIQVLVQGEDRPRNAQVLGSSECWDLAAIQLLGPGDLPYFGWATESPAVATEVYAVGFPAGDPEITVTRGVVSKASVDAQTAWASVDDALETDADINGGNSGGPLVTPDGEVVAVTFAGNATLRQGFGIKAEAAGAIIDRLIDGNDVDYLGINGVAVTAAGSNGVLPEGVPGGIFVQSVETGSDAFNAGIRAGDFIIEVEGTNVAADGTMSEYCDILRSRGSDGDLTIRSFDPITLDIYDVVVTRAS